MDHDYAERMITALKLERVGYVARGLTDRVKQVDKQLAAYGAAPEKTRKPADPDKETVAQKKAREKAEADALAAEQAAYDALSDDEKAALAALSPEDLAALQGE